MNTNEETKEKISSLLFSIAFGNRNDLVNQLLNYYEYDSREEFIELASMTDEQIKNKLVKITEALINGLILMVEETNTGKN